MCILGDTKTCVQNSAVDKKNIFKHIFLREGGLFIPFFSEDFSLEGGGVFKGVLRNRW